MEDLPTIVGACLLGLSVAVFMLLCIKNQENPAFAIQTLSSLLVLSAIVAQIIATVNKNQISAFFIVVYPTSVLLELGRNLLLKNNQNESAIHRYGSIIRLGLYSVWLIVFGVVEIEKPYPLFWAFGILFLLASIGFLWVEFFIIGGKDKNQNQEKTNGFYNNF
jgi:hypothetical protein